MFILFPIVNTTVKIVKIKKKILVMQKYIYIYKIKKD